MNKDSRARAPHKFDFWWLPLARRLVGWSLASALLWALPVVALFAGLVLYVNTHPSPPDPQDGFGIFGDDFFAGLLIWIDGLCSATFALMGALAGAAAGFYTPPIEARNPFKSRFFRRVGGGTFWFLAATSLACALTLILLGWMFDPFTDGWIPLGIWCALSAMFFGLSLWRGVNRAQTVELQI